MMTSTGPRKIFSSSTVPGFRRLRRWKKFLEGTEAKAKTQGQVKGSTGMLFGYPVTDPHASGQCHREFKINNIEAYGCQGKGCGHKYWV